MPDLAGEVCWCAAGVAASTERSTDAPGDRTLDTDSDDDDDGDDDEVEVDDIEVILHLVWSVLWRGWGSDVCVKEEHNENNRNVMMNGEKKTTRDISISKVESFFEIVFWKIKTRVAVFISRSNGFSSNNLTYIWISDETVNDFFLLQFKSCLSWFPIVVLWWSWRKTYGWVFPWISLNILEYPWISLILKVKVGGQ